ncbi:GNAT family N-acetyltransferase [Oxalobacteraceae bacterium]|nr:GNAT family N-acetyltransferase [Oxalobacteraceae bacterium]
MSANLTIHPLQLSRLDDFFLYLNDHLTDNGRDGTALFQPMPRQRSVFPEEKMAAFRQGLATPLNEAGWRRAWVATGANGIQGHIDLRARPEHHAGHRALLGMGVHRAFRRLGLGADLIYAAAAWATAQPSLEWLDLEVLSDNAPALRLYHAHGFVQTGAVEDMFRVDGEQLAYVFMSRRLLR